MTLRRPPIDLDPGKAFPLEPAASIAWQDYACTLVTPLYGGGVKAGEVDRSMPIRASALRGQLRFWWRLLAKHKYRLGTEEIRRREFMLWGGLGEPVQASKVWVRIDGLADLEVAPWAKYEKKPDQSSWQHLPTPEAWANAAYALFPAQGKRPDLADSADPNALAKPGLRWTLAIGTSLPTDADEALREDLGHRVPEALRWWASFGGVGGQTRRGLGAVEVQGLAAVSVEEAAAAGFQLILGRSAYGTASTAWISGINKLKDFRQKEGFARNNGQSRPGRSRWPEPDAIRRATRTHALKHPPEHPADHAYPRAAFGLPIIFQFKDKNAGDPATFTLLPKGAERMASPLLLRPYARNGKWFSAALLLPHEHVERMSLGMPDGSVATPQQWWRPEQAAQVAPMTPYGQDALSAFLNYFAK